MRRQGDTQGSPVNIRLLKGAYSGMRMKGDVQGSPVNISLLKGT